jgi:hypothetical protein
MSKKRSAKGQFVAKRATKATKVMRPKRRARRNPDDAGVVSSATGILAPVANPPDMSELADFVLPGFAGFAATKLLARIVAVQAAKRWPNAGKHVAVGSTVVAFLAAWMLLHRIKKLAPYQMPATVGAGIAALQSAVAAWLPKYGWMVSEPSAENAPLLSSGAQRASMPSGAPVETLFPGGPEVVGDDEDDVLVTDGIGDIDLGSLGGGTVESYADAN